VARTTYPPTLDSSFTVSTSSNFVASNHYGCSIGYLVQSNAAAVNPTWGLGSAQSEAARIATFKPLVTPGSGGTGGSASTTMRFVHTDNLSGSSVVTDATGSVVEAEDFYPYGGLRVDSKTSGYGGVRNKYAGTIYDALSGLNYAQARYQNSNRGQFISEDPVFLGDPKQQTLNDPQSLNGYSYGNDNPITKSDPSGNQSAVVQQAPLIAGAGAYLSPQTMGFSALVVGAGFGTVYLASRMSAEAPFPYGTPGYFQAATLARGSAGQTDPQLPTTPPKIPWGKAILTVVGSTVALGALEEYCGNWCLPALFPGIVPQGFDPNNPNPVVSLPGMTIGGSPSAHTACGTLCSAPQQPKPYNNSTSVPRTSSGSSAGASSGGGSSGSGTWGVVGPGSFNPFAPH
jgi:RHS repeat-associated protein